MVNPPLVKAFEKKRLELAAHVDWEDCKPILAFHGIHTTVSLPLFAFLNGYYFCKILGTAEANIAKIVKNNFDFSKIGIDHSSPPSPSSPTPTRQHFSLICPT